MKVTFKILSVLLIFSSCGLSNKSIELKKYKEWVLVDSMRIVDLDLKYNNTLSEIENLKKENKKLDSLLNECK